MKQSSAKKGSKEQEQEEEAAEKKRLQKKNVNCLHLSKICGERWREERRTLQKNVMNELQCESVIVWRVLNTLLLGESNGDSKEKE